MPKLTEKKVKTETEKATEAITDQFKALTEIANIENTKTEQKKETEEVKKARKDQLVTFNLPAEDYEKYKRWFGSKGMSMSMGIRMCLDYINFQDTAGNLILTKSGIRENNIMKLN